MIWDRQLTHMGCPSEFPWPERKQSAGWRARLDSAERLLPDFYKCQENENDFMASMRPG